MLCAEFGLCCVSKSVTSTSRMWVWLIGDVSSDTEELKIVGLVDFLDPLRLASICLGWWLLAVFIFSWKSLRQKTRTKVKYRYFSLVLYRLYVCVMLISSFCLFNAKKNKLKSSLQLFLPPAFNNCLKKLVFSQLSRSTNKFKSNRSHRRLYLVIRHENEIKLNYNRLFWEILVAH